jgi:hypothetical protein
MGSIDNPVDAIKESYKEESQPGHQTVQLVLAVLGSIVPLVSVYNAVAQHFTGQEARKRVEGLFDEVLNLLNALGKDVDKLSARVESPEFLQTMIEAADRTARTASKKKVQRFAAVLTHELAFGGGSEQEWEDAAAYIRDIAELSEADIKVMSYLYEFQAECFRENKIIDFRLIYSNYGRLLGNIENRGFIKDEFYARCAKLSGFGLVLSMDRKSPAQAGDYVYRLTGLGKHFVDILRKTDQ